MSPSSKAVFLSYASEDADAAQRICLALRAAGVEVWFDREELRGGDAWDRRIREQIHACLLFVPIVSSNTEARIEGYFRREWKLAVDRTHDLSERATFLVPVVIDATAESKADVPDVFRRVQWTRLPGGESTPGFVQLVRGLLSSPAQSAATTAAPARPLPRSWVRRPAAIAAVALVVIMAFAYVALRPGALRHSAAPQTPAADEAAAPTGMPAAFDPPAHSIAVLPFVNMSGDASQDYFADGLTEELLDSLSRIDELHVAARTSAFAFKGQQTDIGTIARKLNVGAVLEGSVRRSAHTVRITTQLVNAVTGYHLWSQSFDRNAGDVLKLETEIATAVASALKVRLLEGTAQRIELGGTANPAAFDAYLRGRTLARTAVSAAEARAVLAAYTEAVELDPRFATAFAERSIEFSDFATFNAQGAQSREAFDKALADAHNAVALAPDLGLAHYALAVALKLGRLQLREADAESERALQLAPGNGRIVAAYSRHAAEQRHTAAAIEAGRRAIALDPLNFHVHRTVGIALFLERRYTEALAAFQTAISLQPDYARDHELLGEAHYALGDLEGARVACEFARDKGDPDAKLCLAMTYWKLGRRADAQAALKAARASGLDGDAVGYARVYAQWGDVDRALEWLGTAVRRQDPDLSELKAEPEFDPLRSEPRFQAIERSLGFPD